MRRVGTCVSIGRRIGEAKRSERGHEGMREEKGRLKGREFCTFSLGIGMEIINYFSILFSISPSYMHVH